MQGRTWWVATVMLVALCGCARTTPEQRLRDTVAALQAAIEARDAGDMCELLAEDFIGNDGLDRDGAHRLAAVYFMRNAAIGITPGPLDIRLQDGHASVRTTVVLTGGSGGLLPDSGRVLVVTSGWRLEDGEWRLSSVLWQAP